MGTEGCNWSKSRICLCVYLDNGTVQNSTTSLHFNVVFLSFLCSFIFLLVHSLQSFEKPFCFFVIQMNHITEVKLLQERKPFFWLVFFYRSNYFVYECLLSSAHSLCVFLWSCLIFERASSPTHTGAFIQILKLRAVWETFASLTAFAFLTNKDVCLGLSCPRKEEGSHCGSCAAAPLF